MSTRKYTTNLEEKWNFLLDSCPSKKKKYGILLMNSWFRKR